MNTIECPLHQFPNIRPWLPPLPPVKDSRKRSQEEVPRTTSRVDHAETSFRDRLVVFVEHWRGVESKLIERRIQRPVENELFDKLRRLQQGIFLARRLGQVLIQVAQESSVPIWISEVVVQSACVGVNLLKEPQHLTGRIAREPVRQFANRVVLAEDILRPRQLGQLIEDRQ